MLKRINLLIDILFAFIVGFALIKYSFDDFGESVHFLIGIIAIILAIRIGLKKPRMRDYFFTITKLLQVSFIPS